MISLKLYLKLSLFFTLIPLFLFQGDSFSHSWADRTDIDAYKLRFVSTNADCTFSTADNPALVKIAGSYDEGTYTQVFDHNADSARFFFLKKEGKINSDGSVEYNFNPFRKGTEKADDPQNAIQVFLSKKKSAHLELDFRSGKGTMNLSGLPLDALQIRAGSADVDLVYGLNQPNVSKLDTLKLQADAGTVSIAYLDHFNSGHVVADIKYGKVKLGFSKFSRKVIRVKGQVTAGRLEINLPENNSPVVLRLHRSRMAGAQLPASLILKSTGLYTNEHYYVNAPGVIFLDITLNGGSLEITD